MLRVLSLCDGLSGGLLAFKSLEIPVKYFAVEIDKFARTLADSNLPEIRRPFNDVYQVTEEWVKENGPFDWVIFGSPCQSVSVAGKGEGLNGSSGLLIECLKILRWAQKYNPSCHYLIENVKMKKSFKQQFDDLIGGGSVLINSALVSAQNRERYYWTDFPVGQPSDRGLVIADILEDAAFFSEREKSYCITANYSHGVSAEHYLKRGVRQIVFKYSESNRYKREDGSTTRKASEAATREVERRLIPSDKSLTITTGDGCGSGVKAINLVIQVNPDKSCGGKQPSFQDRIYSPEGKSVAMTSFAGRTNVGDELVYRKLTVRECARLQTIPEWYSFSAVSKTQAYKAIGNGWTIEAIAHIISESWW